MSSAAESVAFPGIREPEQDGSPGRGAPPARAQDVELLGRFSSSGHRRPPALVRRGDGQIIQLTPLLYEVLREIDGRRDHAQIGHSVGTRVGKTITGDDVHVLTESKLRPLGLLRGNDGMEPVTKKANPLLALRLRLVLSNPRVTGRIAALFSWLFFPPIVLAVTLSFATTIGWLLLERGLASATRHAFYEPGLLLLIFALTTISAGFHELGHAAACRYSGARPGAMGAGLYLVWPAFYTDVSDAYRLNRRGRLRVDLGGIYFNALFALGAVGLWAITNWEALLVLIALQGLQMLRQLIPLVRLDGYHILADLTGIPDLFAHIGPILRGLVPGRSRGSKAATLKPWARIVVTAWVLVVVPVLALVLVLLSVTLPRIAATAWDSLGRHSSTLRDHLADGYLTGAGVEVLAVLALAIPVLSVVYLIARVIARTTRRVWSATAGRPGRRFMALVVAAGLVAALATAWWPHGQYRPIQENERWTLSTLRDPPWPLDGVVARAQGSWALLSSPELDSVLGAPQPAALPAPSPLVVAEDIEVAGTVVDRSVRERSFRFPLPAPPGEGDNQALALNTRDGSTLIDLALSLIFSDEELIDNSNEAYALASCVRCVTVAIAFQVIVISGDDATVIPENVAMAINAECATCLTYAAATQLVVSLIEPLSDEELQRLQALFKELRQLKAEAPTLSLTALDAQLDSLQEEIAAVFEDDEGELDSEIDDSATASDPTAAAPSTSPSPSPSSSPSSSPSPSQSPSSSPSESPTPEPSPSP